MLPPGSDPPSSPGSGRWLSPSSGSAEDRTGWAKLINLQRRILPQIPPVVPGYRLVLSYRPAFVVTGDYHDFFRRSDGLPATFVGDGSGHGPAASLLMATMRTLLHTHDVHRTPGETLTYLGSMFHQLTPSDLFMTGLYVVLAPDGLVSWAAGGHHPPLWLTRTGRLADVDLAPVGPVLGFETATYPTVQWQLGEGDRLLLFTDGLWDARSQHGEPFGLQRLMTYFTETLDRPLGDMIAGLQARVTAHLQGADFEDDFTIVGIERTS